MVYTGHMQKKSLIQWLILLVLVGGGLALWLNMYLITDQIKLAFYSPSDIVESLATNSGMSDYGRRLFYVSDPQVMMEAQFDERCVFGELGLVLGCYDGANIYILDVQEDRLEPVEPVTAAHEMLHAAYARLSDEKIRELKTLLDKQSSESTSARIEEEIASYKNDPNTDIYNEMHSLYGSEYGDLIPELEEYYKQYFSDRSIVLKRSKQYEQVFEQLKAKIDAYDLQLKKIKTTIEQDEATVTSLGEQIDDQRATMRRLEASNQIDEYNAMVPGFNALVEQHNDLIMKIRQDIKNYNDIVLERNENVFEQNDLIKSLDSDLVPIKE